MMISYTVERKKIVRRKFHYNGAFRQKRYYEVIKQMYCVLENGKILCEARSKLKAEQIKEAMISINGGLEEQAELLKR